MVRVVYALVLLLCSTLLGTSTSDDGGDPSQCPIHCLVKLSQAWAQVIGLGEVTKTSLDDLVILGKNDTFSLMCSLYGAHLSCLKGCDGGKRNNENPIQNLVPKFNEVCGADHDEEFDNAAPILANQTSRIQGVCAKVNENALAAAFRLFVSSKQMIDEGTLKGYCSATSAQVRCQFQMVRPLCGEDTYELLRRLIDASFATLRVSIQPQALTQFFAECGQLLTVTGQGIDLIENATLITPNTTAIQQTTTEEEVNTTTTTSKETTTLSTTTRSSKVPAKTTTLSAILKDAADPYEGDVITTTPSKAPRADITLLTMVISLAMCLIMGSFS